MTYYSILAGFLNCTKTLIILSICLCSCASVRGNRPFAYLTDRSKYILLPPDGIEYPMDMPQQISASYGGRDFLFNAWVQAGEAGFDMTLLNELGATMGELSYRDGEVSFSSPVFPKSLKPEYIVADFQLCFYNALLLRQALEKCGLSFEYTDVRRRVLQGKNVIIEIEKNLNSVRLVNHLRGYAYTLEGEFQ